MRTALPTNCLSELCNPGWFSPCHLLKLLTSREHQTDLAPERQLASHPMCHMSRLSTAGVLPLDWLLIDWQWSSLRKREAWEDALSAILHAVKSAYGFS